MEAEEEGKKDEEEKEEEEEEKKSKDGSSSSSKDEEEKEEEKNKRLLTSSVREVAVLISLLIGCSAEETKLCTYGWHHCTEVKLKTRLVLENFKTVAKQVKDPDRDSDKGEHGNLKSELFSKENKWDNIVVLVADGEDSDLDTLCTKYMNEPNSQSCLLVKLFLKAGYMEREKTDKSNKNRLSFDFKGEFRGVSEQILRIVAERGSSRLLQHVEHMDKVHKIPPPEGAAKLPRTTSAVVPVPDSPKLRWRGVRVFISSTFRDMHAERDVLVRAVFPELRRRAAAHRLHLQEVELRWGVTEEESGRAAELCLTEVCRCHLLVGVLGERYGTVAGTPPHLPDLPQHRWLASAPADLSITELEIRQFEALYPDDMNQRAFCYFRDPAVLQSVPVAWRSHFAPESKQAQAKVSRLKDRILKKGVKVTEDYPCEWDGVVGGNPYLRGLEEFGKAVLEDLWTAVLKQYVEADDEEEAQSAVAALSGVSEQGDHQEALRGRFHGRAKLLAEAAGAVRGARAKGGVLLVHGAAGEGKSVFMAALAHALGSGDASEPKPAQTDVLSYSTGASQSARTVENLLRCLVQWLRAREDKEEQSPLPVSYTDLIKEFRLKLTDVRKDQSLALLVDGAELVQDGRGQLNSDWIPQEVPKGMCLVVSVTNGSALLQALTKKKGAILFPLGQLSMTDRKEIVQKGLDMFGKKLSDAAFNNQLQTLMMKNGAASPLYLHLACEDLRNFASFEKMKESLQQLPQSLSQLVGRALDRLLSQYRAVGGLRLALGALALSTTGVREGDLYGLLNSVSERPPGSGLVPWPTALGLARTPTGRVPMATFTQMVRSLQSLIGQAHSRDDLLALTNPDVRRAFEELLLPDRTDRICCHQILSAHLWAAADPLGTETFLHCEADHIKQLPDHLMKGDQCEALGSLLSNYYFLYANVRHGLVHHLLAIYGSYGGSMGLSAERCADFLRRHAVLLSSWPPLFLQQALNEPLTSGAHAWARGLVGKGGPRGLVRLLNHDGENEARPENCELVSTFSSEPTCVALNPRAELVAVGTGQGTLHLIHTQTGQVVKSLESSCDGISSCVFLTDVTLATTSFSGQIEVWDTENGCRTALIEGHSNRITGSDVSPDRKHLATVSLDFQLKVWSATKGHQVASRYGNSPINCVTFNPEGDLLAFGCWDGKVVLWNWLQNKLIRSITGHEGSVRSLSFSSSSSSSSSTLVSGSLSGEVKVWAVPEGTCVGSYQAHRGSTAALTFLDRGNKLLSAGADHTLHLWSGGLGCSMATLRQGRCEQASPRKRPRSSEGGGPPRSSEPPALCVAVRGGCAAVGYHGNGLRLFSLDSETSQWASEDLRVSVLCLLWLSAPPLSDAEDAGAELLVSAGADRHLRLWRRSQEGGLVTLGDFGGQTGDVLALAQSSTHLASASDDFTIALWSVADLTLDPWVAPTALWVLRGHSRGVTCLAFSPDGTRLLSGGKDQALVLWDTGPSPPALSKALLHAHKDWITSCAWAAGRAVSSSNDGSISVWDLDTSSRITSITWKNPLTSICVQGEYLVAGCTEGALHVWKWASATEVSHIPAHAQRIHHCSILPSTDKPEDMVVATASEDGSVQLWKPFQVEHFCTFQGHSGAVRGVVSKNGLTEFLSVSADLSLRSWAWEKDGAPAPKVLMVTAVCYSQTEDALLAAYESGLVEIWQRGAVVGRKQVSDRPILALCSMPDARFAVSCKRSSVQLLRLVWTPGGPGASLVKLSTFPVKHPLAHLHYCSTLIGVSEAGTISDVMVESRQDTCSSTGYVFGTFANDSKSMWLVGRREDELELSFLFVVGLTEYRELSFTNVTLPTAGEEGITSITAVAVDDGLLVCGDVEGNMWFKDSLVLSPWSPRRPAHRDRISVIKITSTAIISASHDQTVKLWDKITKKQVGMFVCGSPVQVLEVSPRCPGELVCGDEMGKLYFLRWNQ